MTKTEAAKFLGVSERQVERYVNAGKLAVHYVKGKTYKKAVFDPAEVGKLKAELDVAEHRATPADENHSSALATTQTTTTSVGEVVGLVAVHVADAVLSQQEQRRSVVVPIADKLTLTLKEAAALSGLSVGVLTDAIHAKKLKASKERARGWNIKRVDLDDFIKKL